MKLQTSGSLISIQEKEILNWTPVYCTKSADLEFFFFADNLAASFLNLFMRVSYLKVICAQSWGHLEAIGDLRGPKSSS